MYGYIPERLLKHCEHHFKPIPGDTINKKTRDVAGGQQPTKIAYKIYKS